jgi:hypothetical protein
MKSVALCLLAGLFALLPLARGDDVDATTLRGKVLAGYQGWFRCPGDAAGQGWVHWSRDGKRIAPETLTFEMWPEMSEYAERFAAPGFWYPEGKQAELFSSDSAATVLRHFEWMHDYGIDGAWLQHFLVDIQGGPSERNYQSRHRVLAHVRAAAQQTGRVWALTFDMTGTKPERILELLTSEWKKLVDDGVANDARYLHEKGLPVVEVFGFYPATLSPEIAGAVIDFFKSSGPYQAYLVGGGDWNWRRNPDPAWQAIYRRFDAFLPWNIGNLSPTADGTLRATTNYWAADREECEKHGMLWLPVIYPGFSWDNLKRAPAGTTNVPRRGGRFLWEQFRELSRLGVEAVFVAMFDEVDEGTAIFKVTNSPPTQARFLGYEGLPSDWYLRLVGEGSRRLREKRPIDAEIPLRP